MIVPETAAWLEIWTDVPAGGDSFLLVSGFADGRVLVADVRRDDFDPDSFDNYADARAWLNEDEYDQVEGRFAPKASSGE